MSTQMHAQALRSLLSLGCSSQQGICAHLRCLILHVRSFGGVHIALFSAGGSTSKKFGPLASDAGATVRRIRRSCRPSEADFRLVCDVHFRHDWINLFCLKGYHAQWRCDVLFHHAVGRLWTTAQRSG